LTFINEKIRLRNNIFLITLLSFYACVYGRFFHFDDDEIKREWAEILEKNKENVPDDFPWESPQKRIFQKKLFTVYLFSAGFAQGEAVYIEIIPKTPVENIEPEFHNREIILSEASWGYNGLFAIHPEHKPGKSQLKISYEKEGNLKETSVAFKVHDTEFPVSKTMIKLGRFSDVNELRKPEIQDFIKKCRKKNKIALSDSTDSMIDGEFSYPAQDYWITSAFWKKRIRYRYDKTRDNEVTPKVRNHKGLDIGGFPGDPIYALADGRVVLAEKLYYEGKYTVIDHGNEIFSGYLHQKNILVEKGDEIEAGEKIGEIGLTGASTGAHLHVFLRINGVYADPLSLLPLPYRD